MVFDRIRNYDIYNYLTVTGYIDLANSPVNPTHAVNKDYVDTLIAHAY